VNRGVLIVLLIVAGIPATWVALCLIVVTAPVTLPAAAGVALMLAVCRPRRRPTRPTRRRPVSPPQYRPPYRQVRYR
jgi:hypothetical protein